MSKDDTYKIRSNKEPGKEPIDEKMLSRDIGRFIKAVVNIAEVPKKDDFFEPIKVEENKIKGNKSEFDRVVHFVKKDLLEPFYKTKASEKKGQFETYISDLEMEKNLRDADKSITDDDIIEGVRDQLCKRKKWDIKDGDIQHALKAMHDLDSRKEPKIITNVADNVWNNLFFDQEDSFSQNSELDANEPNVSPEKTDVRKDIGVNSQAPAGDKIIFGDDNKISVSEDDEILKAIRENIIYPQQYGAFKEALIRNAEDESLENEILAKAEKSLPAFINDPKNQELVQKAFDDKDFQSESYTQSVSGYQHIHDKFKDRFQDVAWDQAQGDTSRNKEVTNSKGESLCTLIEESHSTPITIGSKTINKHRTIDFPIDVTQDKGPLHLAMIAQDENGQNLPESDAIYFTAHYNKEGKLVEVSSPPIKFSSRDDDAIGYVENNGKIATLPVKRGTYMKMMEQVKENNKGQDKLHSINIAKVHSQEHVRSSSSQQHDRTDNRSSSVVDSMRTRLASDSNPPRSSSLHVNPSGVHKVRQHSI